MTTSEPITAGNHEYTYENQAPYIRRDGAEQWTLLHGPTSNAQTKRILNNEWATEGPFTWKRRAGEPWTLHSQTFTSTPEAVPTPSSNLQLLLVLERQSPGEPDHWSLFVARENEAGTRYQVTGDAESMYYQHEENVELLSSEAFKTAYTMASEFSDEELELVNQTVSAEIPPSAPTRAAVRENCQGWCCRVLEGLVEKGVVTKEALNSVRRLVEPIR